MFRRKKTRSCPHIGSSKVASRFQQSSSQTSNIITRHSKQSKKCKKKNKIDTQIGSQQNVPAKGSSDTRFHQSSSNVPLIFQQGSGEVPTRFHQGSSQQGSSNGSSKISETFQPARCRRPMRKMRQWHPLPVPCPWRSGTLPQDGAWHLEYSAYYLASRSASVSTFFSAREDAAPELAGWRSFALPCFAHRIIFIFLQRLSIEPADDLDLPVLDQTHWTLCVRQLSAFKRASPKMILLLPT